MAMSERLGIIPVRRASLMLPKALSRRARAPGSFLPAASADPPNSLVSSARISFCAPMVLPEAWRALI